MESHPFILRLCAAALSLPVLLSAEAQEGVRDVSTEQAAPGESGDEPSPASTESASSVKSMADEAVKTLEPAHLRGPAGEAVVRIYEARQDRGLWAESADGEKIFSSLAEFAAEHGFPPKSLPVKAVRSLLVDQSGEAAKGDSKSLNADVKRTAALVHLGLLVRGGAANEKDFWGKWDPGEPATDKGLDDLLKDLGTTEEAISDVNPWLQRFVPANPIYARFKAAHKQKALEDGAGSGKDWPVLPTITEDDEPVGEGDTYAALGELEARLAAGGYWKADEPPAGGDRYTSRHAKAVERFQEDHGLASDGILGADTLTVLNQTPAQVIRTLRANLERARWLPDDLGPKRLMVNIPSGTLYAYSTDARDAAPDLTMRIVYGSALEDRQTPMFHDSIQYVVFRPYWNIPDSITEKEILPQAYRNPGFLHRNRYQIVDSFAPDARVYRIDRSSLEGVKSGDLKIRQDGGPGNALGLVKFVFPNSNNVYLHDTPEQHLFERSERDFSHGCIRVEKPVELAEFILGPQGWTAEKIRQAMQGGTRQAIGADVQINIYIVYFTASIEGEQGETTVLYDVYGRDAALIAALEANGILGESGASADESKPASTTSSATSARILLPASIFSVSSTFDFSPRP